MKLKIILFLTGVFLVVRSDLYSQISKEYHFVYIEASADDRDGLQAYVENMYKKVEKQSYLFYLSDQSRPVIATNRKSFNTLIASISNIGNVTINPVTEIEQINKAISEFDFLQFDPTGDQNAQIKDLYGRVVMHFFLEPGTFNTMKLKKYLIDRLLAINYCSGDQHPVEVVVYFSNESLKGVNLKDKTSFNGNEFKLVKY
jgi:hypothetical protein